MLNVELTNISYFEWVENDIQLVCRSELFSPLCFCSVSNKVDGRTRSTQTLSSQVS